MHQASHSDHIHLSAGHSLEGGQQEPDEELDALDELDELDSQSNRASPLEPEHQPDQPVLPPTKIKRKYLCKQCPHLTINPRDHLKHLINSHGHKLRIVECPLCLYACQYRQKLNRHLRLVHKRTSYTATQTSNSGDMINSARSNRLASKRAPNRHRSLQQNEPAPNFNNHDFMLQIQQAITANLSLLKFEDLHAFASQLVPFNNTNSEPVDLSFPDNLKQIIRSLQRQQLLYYKNYRQ